ncbi:Beta-galactosidase [termite gut metagenome]|uniref:Beta-galactosidase n=1 Tax=termite gut metagenome TaxID=433724 RepID=A0A5J4SHL9_9ZZZZ
MRRIFIVVSLFIYLLHTTLKANNYQPDFSAGGFFTSERAGREVFDFNAGWRFYRGDIENAEKTDFDDSEWDIVSTPHTVQLMPAEASGCRNYQGKAWYRKHFTVDPSLKNKNIIIYFEAAMGKSVVYLNGVKVLEHLGGYLPFSIELSQLGIKPGNNCLIAVMTDNSDDNNYLPGKQQTALDFAYHGGIYRDVWMITTSRVYISDPNKANKTASGGVFVQYGEINKKKAEIIITTDVVNSESKAQFVIIENKLCDKSGKVLKTVKSKLKLKASESQDIKQRILLDNPILWYPHNPYLYNVETIIRASDGKPFDGVITRIGIRKIELKGKDGLWLNGEHATKLIGGNRHQDFAYVGNAVPNSQHWKDAKRLKDVGFNIIRVAHYPQDPSFMDACDELGLFVIVATPGWQYWNKDPKFEELIYEDVKNMVRRDRNHPSVIMWEPILNETRYPLDFALQSQKIVHSEQPGAICVADNHSAGIADNYEMIYGWPKDVDAGFKQPIFTREFSENVDDWYAHNANNRASRSWGERPLLVQAMSHAASYNEMCVKHPQFVGGTLWHPFDHQRGYHPDPYWGGMTDAFRQPKYSFYMFKSQIDADVKQENVETGAMIYFAHEISPFSDKNVTIFTNCDEVRLIIYEKDTLLQKAPKSMYDMSHPPIVFENVYDFFDMRSHSYFEKNWQRVSFIAEGIIDGKVVCRVKKMPSRRSSKLQLTIDNAGQNLVANSSDFIPVVCEVTDDLGNVRRLAKDEIIFTVEGEGEIIGDETIGANPRAVEFGSAPVLIRSTLIPGKIKVHAHVRYEGENVPTPASIEFESIASSRTLIYSEKPQANKRKTSDKNEYIKSLTEEEKQKQLDEVERQQTEFGEKEKSI